MPIVAIVFRILLTFVLSSIFGLDRQKSHKPVGFGTYTFVSLGSCALACLAFFNEDLKPLGLLPAIVTGIGFLGAGALIRGTDKVYGFTTAASIWLFAIFGLSIGIGEYFIGILLYVMAWCIIFYDLYLESRGIGTYQRKLSLTTNKLVNEKEIHKHMILHTRKFKVLTAEVNKEKNEITMVYQVEGGKDHLNSMIKNLYSEPWVKIAKIE